MWGSQSSSALHALTGERLLVRNEADSQKPATHCTSHARASPGSEVLAGRNVLPTAPLAGSVWIGRAGVVSEVAAGWERAVVPRRHRPDAPTDRTRALATIPEEQARAVDALELHHMSVAEGSRNRQATRMGAQRSPSIEGDCLSAVRGTTPACAITLGFSSVGPGGTAAGSSTRTRTSSRSTTFQLRRSIGLPRLTVASQS